MSVYNSFFFLRAATNFIDKIKEFRFPLIIKTGPVHFVNWMRIPDAASERSNWMQQLDVVRS